jgi:hypothetical protein
MRRLLRSLERLASAIAIAVVLVLVGIEAAERTGLATEVARGLLAEVLPEGRWDLDHCAFDLAGPSLTLEGVTWTRDGERIARIERVDATLTPLFLGRPRLESARVRGLELRLGARFVQGLQSTGSVADGADADTDTSARPAAIAERAQLVVEDARVLDATGQVLLGRLDARIDLDQGSELSLSAVVRDGQGTRGEAKGKGRLYEDGEFVLDVATGALSLAPLSLLVAERGVEIKGLARLTARARGRSDRLDFVAAKIACDDVSTRAPTATLAVDDLALDGRLEWHPGGSAVGTLSGRVLGRGTWAGGPIVFGWRGGEDPFGDVFVHAPQRVIDGSVQDVVKLAVPGEEQIVDNTFRALGVEGRADVWFGARVVEADPGPRGVVGFTSDLALVGRARGAVSARVDGWPDDDGALQGFPLRVDGVSGTTVYAHRGDHAMRDRMATLPTIGRVGDGSMRVEGWLASPLPPYARATRTVDSRARLRFCVVAQDVAVDAELVEAVRRTGAGVDVEELLAPRAGRVSGRVDLEQSPLLEGFVIAADADLEGVRGRWSEPHFEFEDADGAFELRMSPRTGDLGAADGERRRALGFRVVARGVPVGDSEARVVVSGASRTPDPLAAAKGDGGQLFQWSIDVDNVRTDSEVVAPFRSAEYGAAELLERFALGARLSARYDTTAALFGRDAHDRLFLDGRGVTANVEGVAVVDGRVRAAVERRRAIDDDGEGGDAPWSGAFDAELIDAAGAVWNVAAPLGDDRARELAVTVAGVEPSHAAYRTLATEPLPLTGAFDGQARFDLQALASGSGTLPLPAGAGVHLRGAGARFGKLAISGLTGTVTLEAGRVRSSEIAGELAGSPFEVHDVVFALDGGSVPAPFELPADELGRTVPARFAARLFATNLPLDPRQIASGAPSLVRWAVDHRWRGRADLDGVELAVGFDDDAPIVRARGRVVPHDLFAYFSFPVRLGAADVLVEDLVSSSRGLVGRAVVSDAYGEVAGQKLARAGARVAFDDEQLVLHDLSARVNGGTLTGVPAAVDGGAALRVDLLADPTFRLGLSASRVDVGEVLSDVFGSAVQSRGVLSGTLELEGRGEDLLTYRGHGNARVDGARLWSLPVVRDLFATLGLDATATFDWMSSGFRFAAGRVWLEDTIAHSPIVKLIGGGHVDVDGTLAQKFELHYSLVDKVPFVSKVFYWLQSNFVRVEVGGRVDRPNVRLANFVRDAFRGGDDSKLALPLPPTTPLTPRF